MKLETLQFFPLCGKSSLVRIVEVLGDGNYSLQGDGRAWVASGPALERRKSKDIGGEETTTAKTAKTAIMTVKTPKTTINTARTAKTAKKPQKRKIRKLAKIMAKKRKYEVSFTMSQDISPVGAVKNGPKFVAELITVDNDDSEEGPEHGEELALLRRKALEEQQGLEIKDNQSLQRQINVLEERQTFLEDQWARKQVRQ